MQYNYPIDLLFWIMIFRTTKYNANSESTLSSIPKNISMSLNSILYSSSIAKNLLWTFCFDLYIYILLMKFWHSTSVIFHLSYCSKASLNGCCHPWFYFINIKSHHFIFEFIILCHARMVIYRIASYTAFRGF